MTSPLEPRADQEPSDLVTRLRRWRATPAGRAVTALVALAAIGLSGYYLTATLADGLRQLAADPPPWRWGPALGGLGLTLACVLLGGVIWRLVLQGVGLDVPWRGCLRSHLLANLGGYLPGYAWRYIGKGYLVQRTGVPARVASLAVLAEFVGSGLTRALVAVTFVPSDLLERLGQPITAQALWGLRVFVWGVIVAAPWLVPFVSRPRSDRRRRERSAVRTRRLLCALLLMSGTWAVYGLACALIFRAIHPIAVQQLGGIVFASSSSFLASLVLFVVPAGLGVRESVLAFTLEGVMPPGIIAAGALISRLALVLAELVGAAVGAALGKGTNYVNDSNG